MPDSFLHKANDFRALVATVARQQEDQSCGSRGEGLLDHARRLWAQTAWLNV